MTAQDFTTIIRQMVTTAQAKCSQLIDYSIGSVLRSIFESVAGVALWLQGLILDLLLTTRASTSTGLDLDSWMDDFNFPRKLASAASGLITMARFTTTAVATIKIFDDKVETLDAAVIYSVDLDATNAYYDSSIGSYGGYVIPIGISSSLIPVICDTIGVSGNALADTITLTSTSISGIDTVTNLTPFTNGVDPESDDNYRSRFVTYIAGLSKATKASIESAIESLSLGITYSVIENYNHAGAADPGYFFIIVDDGSGSPSTPILNAVSSAVDAVRGLCISFGVFAPSLLTATIVLTASINSAWTTSATTIKATIQAAVIAYINSLPIGSTLYLTRLAKAAYESVIEGQVDNISAITINSSATDLTATSIQAIRTSTSYVTVN